jgi:hypothetical protein
VRTRLQPRVVDGDDGLGGEAGDQDAVRICDATFGNIYRRDGEALRSLGDIPRLHRDVRFALRIQRYLKFSIFICS